ncbi:MAG TPA: nucleotide exchange factor GrpE [Desulfotomaculum sp.]|nr:nucleotide exchange factor GrpE [Desulfotomaculum sp.]
MQQVNKELTEAVEEKGKGEENGFLDLDENIDKVAEEDVEDLKCQLAEQASRAEEYFQRLARLQADFENYRRRTAREKEELVKFATEQLVVSLLPVIDNFERALASGCENPDKLLEGVEMIYRQLFDLLAAEGLVPIPAVGERFDPARHEAVSQVESSEHVDDTILEEFRRGYYLKDKVIRPSMVKVARPVTVF